MDLTNVQALWLLALVMPATAMGEDPGEAAANQVAEIIVTAQEWAQSANTVVMPITVGTAKVMQTRGIDSVADLTRLVPGVDAASLAMPSHASLDSRRLTG